MNLSNAEIQRIYESMKWIHDKGSIKDTAFISAFDKISQMKDIKSEYYNLRPVRPGVTRRKAYADLSSAAVEFINRRIKEGCKNTYHSIMAVLGNHRQSLNAAEELIDKREMIYESYIQKYDIDEADIKVFDEIFDCAFANTVYKYAEKQGKSK